MTLSTAQAAWYDVRFCGYVDTTFADTASGDKWTTDVDRPARGFWMRVIDKSSGPPYAVVWPPVGSDNYVEDSGANVGCTDEINMSSFKTYDVEMRSWAKVNGVSLTSQASATPGTYEQVVVEAGFSPTSDETVDTSPVSHVRWTHLVTVAYALSRIPEVSSGSLNIYHDGSCCSASGNTLQLGTTTRKYVMAHEVGHWFLRKVDSGGTGVSKDYSADLEGCHGDNSGSPNHSQLSKEYQSAAANEGIADFFAAAVWNTVADDADCEYQRQYDLDWNDDGLTDTFSTQSHACYGDPFSGSPDPVDSEDWLEDLVYADDDDVDLVQCEGTLINRSTQYDWLRYLWGMRTREYVGLSDVWDILDEADPHDWIATSDTLDTGNNHPQERVADAADDLGFGSEHAAMDDHGLDH